MEYGKRDGCPPVITLCYIRPYPSRDSPAGLEEVSYHIVRGPWRGARVGTLITESQKKTPKTQTSVLQPQGLNSVNIHVSLEKELEL